MTSKVQRLFFLFLCIPVVVLAQTNGPKFKLYDPGTEELVEYEKYGVFQGIGTEDFNYVITNEPGLIKAVGEGVDPCRSATNNPEYRKVIEAKLIKKNWWKHVNSSDPQVDYFAWVGAGDDPGVRQLFIGKAMEKGGQYMQALKAYRTAMILYPDSACWSAGSEFQWGVAEASWHAIINLLRQHPELKLRLMDADVRTFTRASGPYFVVRPGRLVRISEEEILAAEDQAGETAAVPPSIGPVEETNFLSRVFTGSPDEILQQRGTGLVQLVQYGNGEWKMSVGGEPFFIFGMNYSPTKIGVVPWEWNWLWADENTNGIVDCFEVWVDANQNGVQDEDEPTTTDFHLMKAMGVNAIKVYVTDDKLKDFNILTLRRMYAETGIRVIIGNFLGAYCHGSGATWDSGTDYTIRQQRDSMKASVSNLVMKLKGEPWLLAWVLGNENNMEMTGDVNATRTNASKYPETYSRFLNEVCRMIHQLDPDHPVGTGNLLTGLVEYYGQFAPELDYLGVNSYLGEDGFGATWLKVRQYLNRPIFIAEYGCDSYHTGKGPDEAAQSRYLLKNWEDIVYNSAGHPGAGNSIGGFVFEWLDEWWKDTLNYFENPVDKQSTRAVFPMPFPDGYAQEEWFGILGQGAGNASPYLRVPKKAYGDLMDTWLKQSADGKEGAAESEE